MVSGVSLRRFLFSFASWINKLCQIYAHKTSFYLSKTLKHVTVFHINDALFGWLQSSITVTFVYLTLRIRRDLPPYFWLLPNFMRSALCTLCPRSFSQIQSRAPTSGSKARVFFFFFYCFVSASTSEQGGDWATRRYLLWWIKDACGFSFFIYFREVNL